MENNSYALIDLCRKGLIMDTILFSNNLKMLSNVVKIVYTSRYNRTLREIISKMVV